MPPKRKSKITTETSNTKTITLKNMIKLSEENLTGVNHDGAYPNLPLRYLTASSLMANKVYNAKQEKLGDIKDIMIDITTGKIEYVVIEFGGFLGIGEKFFALPFRLLSMDTKNETCVLDQDPETLKNAPGFDKDHWPMTNSHIFSNSTSYWGSFMGSNTGGCY